MTSYDELWGETMAAQVTITDDRCLRVVGTPSGDEEFGGEIWPAAKWLASYLVDHPELVRGQRVLELGCGCGLVGIVAAVLGAASVVLTDLEPNLAIARRNACENEVDVSFTVLDWREDASNNHHHLSCDVIVASDVVYKASLVAPLVSVIREIPHSSLLLANETRSRSQRQFGRVLQSCDFRQVREVFCPHLNVLLQHFEPCYATTSKTRSVSLSIGTDLIEVLEETGDGLGGVVWPSALALARFCLRIRVAGHVLELGAGCGLVGLAAARTAHTVVLSDEIVGVAALNARRVPNVSLCVLIWGHEDDTEKFDVVLGAELLQYRDPNLAPEIARRLAGPDAFALITATPCSGDTECTCATHYFLRRCSDAHLRLVNMHHLPILIDSPSIAVHGVDMVLGDGEASTLILELALWRQDMTHSTKQAETEIPYLRPPLDVD